MTAKEKAKQVYNDCVSVFIDDEDDHFVSAIHRIAKKCAIIAMNETIEALQEGGDSILQIQYYLKVSKELEQIEEQ